MEQNTAARAQQPNYRSLNSLVFIVGRCEGEVNRLSDRRITSKPPDIRINKIKQHSTQVKTRAPLLCHSCLTICMCSERSLLQEYVYTTVNPYSNFFYVILGQATFSYKTNKQQKPDKEYLDKTEDYISLRQEFILELLVFVLRLNFENLQLLAPSNAAIYQMLEKRKSKKTMILT